MATAIAIADAAATPVTHTFNPVGFLPQAPDVFLFEDRSPGSFIGYNRITVSVMRPQAGGSRTRMANQNIKVKVQLILPKLETLGNSSSGITPPDTLAYDTKADVTFTLNERCSQLDRDHIIKMVPLLLANVQVQDAVKSFARIP